MSNQRDMSTRMGQGHETGHLLIVDDNKVNRLLLGRGLEQQGHSVDFAENGVLALDKLAQERFDLILLDIEMPELDGYQVLERIIQDTDLRDIPVIMTTATEELESVVRCIELGAEDYLTKPVNAVLLRARINASLEKKRLRDQQRELIKKFATEEVAEQMMTDGFELGGRMVEATVMFSDIRGFTSICEAQSPADIIELLNTYYTLMFEAITDHGGIVNQIIGDGLMSLFGAPVSRPGHPQLAVKAALEMIEMIELFNVDQESAGLMPIKIGIGIATGSVIAGFTGTLRRATYTCVGDAVNQASRLEGLTKDVGQPILINETTRQALGDDIPVEDQGIVPIRGKKEAVRVYSVPVANN
ncbi:MAG TPA: adenylate/guanylate cyclase domain-containing protein [candidate division Zixibacteria bacterium]|nr:adenylate/guanylate cyclase domain-containing protein [candidate division Zixibacteria bacterium]